MTSQQLRDFLVRASSLTEWPDCERRFAARHLGELVADAGYELRQVPRQIGATVGTAVHAGAAHMLRHKMQHGDTGKAADAVEQGIESLRIDMAQGLVLDDTTRTINDAEQQVSRMVNIYRLVIAPQITPIAVEQEMVARFSPTLQVIGHMDVAENDEIRDTKTGVMQRPNHPQYGAYSLLWRANGHTVNRFVEDYIPRGPVNRPQREPRTNEYPLATCEQSARAVLARVDASIAAFAKSGEVWTFLPNPSSMLCSDKFCPAHGTAFCQAHKAK